jgi:cell division ATPase FtsA
MSKDEEIAYLKNVLRAIARNIENAERILGYAVHGCISEAYGRATRTLVVDFGEQYEIPGDILKLPHGPDFHKSMPAGATVN